MSREIGEPETSGTLAGEDVGHPAEGVVEVPEGDADAGLREGCTGEGGLVSGDGTG